MYAELDQDTVSTNRCTQYMSWEAEVTTGHFGFSFLESVVERWNTK